MCMWKGGRRILQQVQPPLARWATNWTIQFPVPHEKKRALPTRVKIWLLCSDFLRWWKKHLDTHWVQPNSFCLAPPFFHLFIFNHNTPDIYREGERENGRDGGGAVGNKIQVVVCRQSVRCIFEIVTKSLTQLFPSHTLFLAVALAVAC